MSNRQYWFWFAVRAIALVTIDGAIMSMCTMALTNASAALLVVIGYVLVTVITITWIWSERWNWLRRTS